MKSSMGKYHDLKGLGKINLAPVCGGEEEGVWLKKGVERAGWKLSHGSHKQCRRFGNGRERVDARGISERIVNPTSGQLPLGIPDRRQLKIILLFWA